MTVPINQNWIERALIAVNSLRTIHRHDVVRLENIPLSGPVLIAVNHSFASYDIVLLLGAIYLSTGRITRPLVDRLFFRLPYLGNVVTQLGCKEGSPGAASELLQGGDIVTVAPGGMEEALRPSTEKYQLRWSKRKGFARLAIDSQVPVILAACPRADDIFDVYGNHLTNLLYKNFRIPIPLVRGLGPTILPRPIQLTHYMSKPFFPPPKAKSPEKSKRVLQEFHEFLVFEMEKLMSEALNENGKG